VQQAALPHHRMTRGRQARPAGAAEICRVASRPPQQFPVITLDLPFGSM